MKNFRIYGLIAAIAVMTGCSSRFLEVEPTGSTVSQKQYEENINSAAAHMRGLYRTMIMHSHSSDRSDDEFGQKAIDIKLDMIAGDIALTNINYGWFSSTDNLDERYNSSRLTSELWYYYYGIIKNANLVIKLAANANLVDPVSDEEKQEANAIAQAYAMRGMAYSNMSYIYPEYARWSLKYPNISDEYELPCVPYYDENSSDNDPQPQLSTKEILEKGIADLDKAYRVMSNIGIRESKTYIDADVAGVLLAYAKLHQMAYDSYANVSNLADEVLDICNGIISGGKYAILPSEKVLTTGFNTLAQNNNWMWGIDIDQETTRGLPTFWGQMDIYTYSYAYAGDVKAIDDKLYGEIPSTDIRKQWFLNIGTYKLAPAGKFYDGRKVIGGDAEWLNDIFFMRIEEVYLIAAEAAALKGDMPTAVSYLSDLVSQRDATVAATLASMNYSDLMDQIRYNWRVELWGEGKSYFTMRRFRSISQRGDNHFYRKGESFSYSADEVSFMIPSAEIKYNPHIHD